MPAFTNALANESSPYLLQHAHNPVNWMPWGEAAFAAARAADKPIFLSVGYSTCYWCHVMERESFEDEATAAILNEHFIAIKVDREERPDVDDIYMLATQIVSGSGGWPMSVFLEPKSLKPFYAGTYFPPEDRYGRPGFPSLLRNIAKAWKTQRSDVDEQAGAIADAVIQLQTRTLAPVPLNELNVRAAVNALMASYDPEHGGFAGSPGARRAPKFPTPVNLDFLIAVAWDEAPVRNAVLHTLDCMAMGGMFDQVGGGFHRYSTDEKWLVPHFEKMLYDNGQLLSTYSEAFARTGDDFYARVLRQTAEYVLREMVDSGGGGGGGMFFSAQDAEVDHREGLNYLWRPDEIRAALPPDDAAFANHVYGLNAGANFVDPHHPEDGGRNVLFLADRPDALAKRMNVSLDEFIQRLDQINATLLTVRSRRKQPSTDEKILTSWNGLMIAGLAHAGRVLNEPRYVDAARRAAESLLTVMRSPDGGLYRSARADAAHIPAFLEDYAFLVHGLLALHSASDDRMLLETASRLIAAARERFWDADRGVWFDTLADQSDLFVRMKSVHDGALPSGNGMMTVDLLRLHELTGEASHLDYAMAALRAMSPTIAEHPTGSIVAAKALHVMLTRHGDRWRRAIDAPSTSQRPLKPAEGPVRMAATPSELRIGTEPATLTVTLDIADGYHINAHDPGIADLIHLDIRLLNGGNLAIDVDFPPAHRLDQTRADSPMIHDGVVTIGITLRRTGAVIGNPHLTITWQACTDAHCLAPITRDLPVRMIVV